MKSVGFFAFLFFFYLKNNVKKSFFKHIINVYINIFFSLYLFVLYFVVDLLNQTYKISAIIYPPSFYGSVSLPFSLSLSLCPYIKISFCRLKINCQQFF